MDSKMASETDGGFDHVEFVAAILLGLAQGAATVESSLADGDSRPLESPAYVEALYGPGEQAKLTSDQFFETAGEANENGKNFELATTILTACCSSLVSRPCWMTAASHGRSLGCPARSSLVQSDSS